MKSIYRSLCMGWGILAILLCSTQFKATAQTTDPSTSSKRLTLRQWRKQALNAQTSSTYITVGDSLTACDTITYIPVLGKSPWRLAIPFGPGIAYCGTWNGTFNDHRDRSLFNGFGLNVSVGADYFFRPENRFKFGLGVEGGWQTFFVRGAYKNYLYAQADAQDVARGNVDLRKRASEDMFLLVGPVISYDLTKKPQSSFLEAAVKAGIFRTQSAMIGAINTQNNQLISMVSPTDKLLHPGVKGHIGAFFPFGNNWYGGAQISGFYTQVNYFTQDNAAHIWEFKRKHGGWALQLALRKSFNRTTLVQVAPAECPTCVAPTITGVTLGDQTITGLTVKDSLANTFFRAGTYPKVTWTSGSSEAGETYTVNVHKKSPESDEIVYSLKSTTERSFEWPQDLKFPGDSISQTEFYYVTVHSERNNKCGRCISEVATASFGFEKAAPKVIEEKTRFRHRLVEVSAYYSTVVGRDSVQCYCYCDGTRQASGTYRKRTLYGTYTQELEQAKLNAFEELKDDIEIAVPAQFDALVSSMKRPRYFKAIYEIDEVKANGEVVRHLGDYQVTITRSKGKYIISKTSIRQITEEEKQRIIEQEGRKAKKGKPRRRN
ncbi:hypothetical protein [Siphonobacter sp.]|uniref:hypothetical protein n=1 Tax=Siphonobacter sp. TaxID=1869184 RepID=UPI003B3B068A